MMFMGWNWRRMKVAVCDICGHCWLPEVANPPICANKACRSRKWNTGGIDQRTREARIKTGRSRKLGKSDKKR